MKVERLIILLQKLPEGSEVLLQDVEDHVQDFDLCCPLSESKEDSRVIFINIV